MSESNKSFEIHDFDLPEQIRAHQQRWHERKTDIESLLEEPTRLAYEDPAAGISALMVIVIDLRRLYRRYLRSRFGYRDSSIDYPFLAYGKAKQPRLIKPERSPSNAMEGREFIMAVTYSVVWDLVWGMMHRVGSKFSGPSEEAFRAMRNMWLKTLVYEIDTILITMELGNSYANKYLSDEIKEEQWIMGLSAWVGARTSFVNKRLKASLEETYYPAFSGLLQELPASTLIELDNIVQNQKLPSELVNLVTNQLANTESTPAKLKRLRKGPLGDLSDATFSEPLLEEFLAKEALAAARTSGKITKAEYEVLKLTWEGYLEREIAEKLDKTIGTVKTLKHRGRQKFRRAEGL